MTRKEAEKNKANLWGADLQGADLQGANLQGANLQGANLRRANLWGADLQGADLQGANLQGANLRRANLQGANLWRANLWGADLQGADLQGADLQGANLPAFQIVPSEGSFIAWKKTTKGVIRIQIPASAQRTSSLVGRKCRASSIIVLDGPGINGHSPTQRSTAVYYGESHTVVADKYDPDIRVECTHGIHFFMTKEEADQW